MREHYDVIVIGGGAAGLSGALMLGRSRRSVLVIDAGEPRNAPAEGVHGFLTRDGMNPRELLAVGRDEVRRYGVEVIDGRVRTAGRSEAGFGVTLGGRDAWSTAGACSSRPGSSTSSPRSPASASAGAVRWCTARTATAGRSATGPSASSRPADGWSHRALLFRQLTDDVDRLPAHRTRAHRRRARTARRPRHPHRPR